MSLAALGRLIDRLVPAPLERIDRYLIVHRPLLRMLRLPAVLLFCVLVPLVWILVAVLAHWPNPYAGKSPTASATTYLFDGESHFWWVLASTVAFAAWWAILQVREMEEFRCRTVWQGCILTLGQFGCLQLLAATPFVSLQVLQAATGRFAWTPSHQGGLVQGILLVACYVSVLVSILDASGLAALTGGVLIGVAASLVLGGASALLGFRGQVSWWVMLIEFVVVTAYLVVAIRLRRATSWVAAWSALLQAFLPVTVLTLWPVARLLVPELASPGQSGCVGFGIGVHLAFLPLTQWMNMKLRTLPK